MLPPTHRPPFEVEIITRNAIIVYVFCRRNFLMFSHSPSEIAVIHLLLGE